VLGRRSHEAGEGIELVTGDLAIGEGIEAAVERAEIIVHCAGSSKGDEAKALNLVRAASRAGARHLVYISVVGADRIPVVRGVDRAMFGYFASKLAAERVVADSGLPWTTLRATQFHDLILAVARQMARLPVVPLPAGFRVQPVDAGEVAVRLDDHPAAGLLHLCRNRVGAVDADVGIPRTARSASGCGQRTDPGDVAAPRPRGVVAARRLTGPRPGEVPAEQLTVKLNQPPGLGTLA
jgi:nucleoside-diphosphate-sugar epimerase